MSKSSGLIVRSRRRSTSDPINLDINDAAPAGTSTDILDSLSGGLSVLLHGSTGALKENPLPAPSSKPAVAASTSAAKPFQHRQSAPPARDADSSDSAAAVESSVVSLHRRATGSKPAAVNSVRRRPLAELALAAKNTQQAQTQAQVHAATAMNSKTSTATTSVKDGPNLKGSEKDKRKPSDKDKDIIDKRRFASTASSTVTGTVAVASTGAGADAAMRDSADLDLEPIKAMLYDFPVSPKSQQQQQQAAAATASASTAKSAASAAKATKTLAKVRTSVGAPAAAAASGGRVVGVGAGAVASGSKTVSAGLKTMSRLTQGGAFKSPTLRLRGSIFPAFSAANAIKKQQQQQQQQQLQ